MIANGTLDESKSSDQLPLTNPTRLRLRKKKMYSSDFYSRRDAATAHAAESVLSIVMGVLPTQSVCDVGCGTGTWLRVAKELDAVEVLGFEGAWVEDKHLVVDAKSVRWQDLEQPVNSDRRFDLAICLEVAEHLSPTRGPELVTDLCRLSDAVLFSAAIPDQRGTGHVNEQWQSYWAAHFEKHGFRPFDLVRPKIWSDEGIPYWYRQNTLVYVAESSVHYERLRAHAESPTILDVIHPALHHRKEFPTVPLAAMRLVRALYKRHWRRSQ